MTSQDAGAVVDHDTPDVETEMPGQFAIARLDPRTALAEFEAAAEMHPKLVKASIKMTKPQDWIAMGGKVYLQGTGVERMATPWGLVFGEPKVVREDYPDGEFAYIVTGPVGSRRTGVYYTAVQGGRSSRDPFFDAFTAEKPDNFRQLPREEQEDWKRKHRIPPDPMEVRKAAFTNWQTRGASMVTGMRGLTLEDVEKEGLVGIKKVEFRSGSKGGDATPGDLKAEATAFWNECIRVSGGDLSMAKQVMRECTSYPAKEGQYAAFAGIDSPDKFRDVGKVRIALNKLKAHPLYADKKREPGGEG